MSNQIRIPFAEAISDPRLFKARFDSLSMPQQVLLKTCYGAPLVDDAEHRIWSALQGGAAYDELGYLVDVQTRPYVAKEYREIWGIVGRRASKTDSFAATATAYEAACGGHEAFLRPGQRGICFQIAQDLRMARYSLHFIRAALESSPMFGGKFIRNITADQIELANGMTIACVPPTLKSVRGYASPVAVLDEVGVWYQESDSANPDYEIYRALSPGQLQFPDRKIIGISTPWNKAGLLYKFYEAGTEGAKLPEGMPKDEFQDILVHHGTTALMQNPVITKEFLAKERARDPQAFARECLCEFQDAIAGLIPGACISRAIQHGVFERAPESNLYYVAAMDPAFRKDAFAFTIVHRGYDGKIVQDVVRRWLPKVGVPLNPLSIIVEVASICHRYGTGMVYSDQYQLESLDQLAQQSGLSIIRVPFTSKSKWEMYGSLQQSFLQNRTVLLDNAEMIKELRCLERSFTQGGNVQIGAPSGEFDDLASAYCLAVSQSMLLAPQEPSSVPKEPSLHERCLAQIERKREEAGQSIWD